MQHERRVGVVVKLARRESGTVMESERGQRWIRQATPSRAGGGDGASKTQKQGEQWQLHIHIHIVIHYKTDATSVRGC